MKMMELDPNIITMRSEGSILNTVLPYPAAAWIPEYLRFKTHD